MGNGSIADIMAALQYERAHTQQDFIALHSFLFLMYTRAKTPAICFSMHIVHQTKRTVAHVPLNIQGG
jgi:hypothetical protein